MKMIIALIILSLFSTKGCKKNHEPASVLQPDISGTWELSSRKGGNIMSADFLAGNGNIIKFTADKYEVWVNKELLNSGSYKIEKDNTGNYIIIYQGSN